jgi:DNA-binding CsgD family transcriptional regulator
MSLGSLGITEFEESVYRALLCDPQVTIDSDQNAVRAAIARLAELELVHMDEGGPVVAVDPEAGISRLIRQRLLEVNVELGRISGVWQTLPGLTADFRNAAEVNETVERIDDAAQVGKRIWSIAQDAVEVLAVHPHVGLTASKTAMLPHYLQRLGEGVRWRTIVPRPCLKNPAVLEYVTTLHRAGDLHRVVETPLQQMVIVDRAVSFVAVKTDQKDSGALMIRHRGAVATLVQLFEQVWAYATDLEPAAPCLTPRERQVLFLLTSADKDELAAREMGVSLRTYRREVAKLLTRFGVANRVQCAVLAKEQGWI